MLLIALAAAPAFYAAAATVNSVGVLSALSNT